MTEVMFPENQRQTPVCVLLRDFFREKQTLSVFIQCLHFINVIHISFSFILYTGSIILRN